MKHDLGKNWEGPEPHGPAWETCAKRCDDCGKVVAVAGGWDQWETVHAVTCQNGATPEEVATSE